MRSTPRSLGLHGAALSAGLIALLTLPGCTSGSDSDVDDEPVTAEPAAGAVGADEDLGDGEESLDDDGYLGDSTSSGVGAGGDHGREGDDTGGED